MENPSFDNTPNDQTVIIELYGHQCKEFFISRYLLALISPDATDQRAMISFILSWYVDDIFTMFGTDHKKICLGPGRPKEERKIPEGKR